MGIFMSCCKPSAADVATPDAETRRRQQVEAAERRRAEAEARGIKNPEKVQRQIQKAQEIEKREQNQASQGAPVLQWRAN